MDNRVREQRLERGLTQEQLGSLVGVSRRTIISIETGRFAPSLTLDDPPRSDLRDAGRGALPPALTIQETTEPARGQDAARAPRRRWRWRASRRRSATVDAVRGPHQNSPVPSTSRIRTSGEVGSVLRTERVGLVGEQHHVEVGAHGPRPDRATGTAPPRRRARPRSRQPPARRPRRCRGPTAIHVSSSRPVERRQAAPDRHEGADGRRGRTGWPRRERRVLRCRAPPRGPRARPPSRPRLSATSARVRTRVTQTGTPASRSRRDVELAVLLLVGDHEVGRRSTMARHVGVLRAPDRHRVRERARRRGAPLGPSDHPVGQAPPPQRLGQVRDERHQALRRDRDDRPAVPRSSTSGRGWPSPDARATRGGCPRPREPGRRARRRSG